MNARAMSNRTLRPPLQTTSIVPRVRGRGKAPPRDRAAGAWHQPVGLELVGGLRRSFNEHGVLYDLSRGVGTDTLEPVDTEFATASIQLLEDRSDVRLEASQLVFVRAVTAGA